MALFFSLHPSEKKVRVGCMKTLDQSGKVIVKFYWLPLIISLGLSVLLTIILNVVF